MGISPISAHHEEPGLAGSLINWTYPHYFVHRCNSTRWTCSRSSCRQYEPNHRGAILTTNKSYNVTTLELRPRPKFRDQIAGK
jgi:hypothetical protein